MVDVWVCQRPFHSMRTHFSLMPANVIRELYIQVFTTIKQQKWFTSASYVPKMKHDMAKAIWSNYFIFFSWWRCFVLFIRRMFLWSRRQMKFCIFVRLMVNGVLLHAVPFHYYKLIHLFIIRTHFTVALARPRKSKCIHPNTVGDDCILKRCAHRYFEMRIWIPYSHCEHCAIF